MDINGDRLWSDIQELGRIGCNPDGSITRLSFTPQDRQAQDWLEARMADAGLLVREDAAGNLIGELSGSCPENPALFAAHITIRFQEADGLTGPLASFQPWKRSGEYGNRESPQNGPYVWPLLRTRREAALDMGWWAAKLSAAWWTPQAFPPGTRMELPWNRL